ncbi:MAG: right-handed parallel beta-helix repeat-containing protein [Chlamydiales bacterium]
MRVAVRYTTPRGIGYSPGYTTLEGFLSQMYRDRWLPFLDLRGHVFDTGRLAANAGVGLRYLSRSRVWGINSYYDYRDTKRQHYNQVAIGLESLGEVWDVRLNGYLPVGEKRSRPWNPKFDHFSGNSMYLRAKRDSALKGANLEIGAHVDRIKSAPLYFNGGPYYLTGKGVTTWGGALRGAVDLFKGYLRIEANLSYDHFFKWIGQGQIGVNVPFGKREKMRDRGLPCPSESALYARTEQRVDRNEIIPVGRTHVTEEAIDPSTGEPYFFVFVDNTSSSLGTYESPYASLAAAQENSSSGDIIYVFPGDGSSNNMNSGITLQNSQMLLGASTPYSFPTSLGTISVPALASTMPVLTNTTASPAITLANNNTVSGLYIANETGNGIFGAGIDNFTATQNSFIGGAVGTGAGEPILLNNVSGEIAINDNFFSQLSPLGVTGYAVHIAQTDAQCNASFNNDTIISQYNSQEMNGIFADLSGTGSIGALNITNSSLLTTDDESAGVLVSLADSSYVSNIRVSNIDLVYWDSGIEVNLAGTGSIANMTLANSDFSRNYYGLYVDQTGSGSIANVELSNCIVTGGGEYGLYVNQTSSGSIANLTLLNCNINNTPYAIYTDQTSTSSIANLTLVNCNLGSSDSCLYHDIDGTASIANLTLLNSTCYAGSYALYGDITADGSVANVDILNCTFNGGVDEGVYFSLSNDNSFQNLAISNSAFSGIEYPIYFDGAAAIQTLAVNGCTFTGNQYCFYLDIEGVDDLNISNNNFFGNEYAVFSYPEVSHGVIANNQFNGTGYNALVITTLSGSSNVLSIANNSFTGAASPTQGYGALITTTASSTLCLDFVNNVAVPITQGGEDPYSFIGTDGTFNLTSQSTQANNIGIIHRTGAFGSCSQ